MAWTSAPLDSSNGPSDPLRPRMWITGAGVAALVLAVVVAACGASTRATITTTTVRTAATSSTTSTTAVARANAAPFTDRERAFLNISNHRAGRSVVFDTHGIDLDYDGYIDVDYETADGLAATRDLLNTAYRLCATIAAEASSAGVNPLDVIDHHVESGYTTAEAADELRLALMILCPEREMLGIGSGDGESSPDGLTTTSTANEPPTNGPFASHELEFLNLNAKRRGLSMTFYGRGLDSNDDGYLDVSWESVEGAEQWRTTREYLDVTYELCEYLANDARDAGSTPADIIDSDRARGAISEDEAEDLRLAFVVLCPERLGG